MMSDLSTRTIENAFLRLGLTSEHAAVYFSVLKLGPSPASLIAKASNLPRSSTYDILTIISKRGFISVVEGKSTKIFTAVNPKNILEQLKKEKDNLESSLTNMHDNITTLENMFLAHKAGLPKVSYFEGESGMKTVLYDCLNSKDIIYGICQGVSDQDNHLKDEPQYLIDFLNEVRSRKIRVKDLLEDSISNREFKEEFESKYYKCLIIPPRTKHIEHVDKQIYDNKIAYISHDNKIGIIIENETLAIHEKQIFEDLWSFYKELRNEIS